MPEPVYLNTAAAGLISPASLARSTAFAKQMLHNPSAAFAGWLAENFPVVRENTARLLGCDSSRIAFVPNFSFGFNAVLQSLAGKIHRVLLFDQDYPSVNLPVTLGGFEVSYVESSDGFSIPFSAIRSAVLQRRIDAVVLSHVQFLTGFMLDVEELGTFCRKHGVLFILDATQSMGVLDYHLDLLPVDVVISSSYKWLNGGYGSAVLYLEESFINRFPPKFAGFGSMTLTPEGWSYAPSARSFEPGHFSVEGLLRLEVAVTERLAAGQSTVMQHDLALTGRLAAGLEKTSFSIRGGVSGSRAAILSFDASEEVAKYLATKNIVVTFRRGMIRVSPHLHNQPAEIDFLIEVLEQYGK